MAKSINNVNKTAEQRRTIPPVSSTADNKAGIKADNKYTITGFRLQAIILALLGFVFYANSISNEYAFDDMMAIVDNAYVQRGVAGIPDIMTHDAYQSYLEQRNGGNQLAGGRYRPLSLISFAVEQQVLGVNPVDDNSNTAADRTPETEAKLAGDMHVRHFINIALYILASIVLLRFLRQVVFPDNPLLAFLAVVLFVIHPLHTEVVANVKSRDEILSVLFIFLTFIKAFKYIDGLERRDLVWACVYFFLALLSKEYAALLVVLLPLSFFMFRKQNMQQVVKNCLPYLIPLVMYFIFRYAAVQGGSHEGDSDIMNNPYAYANGIQKAATILLVLLQYLKLLFVPHPLIADYSYNQIPYTNFSDMAVWLSIGIYSVLFGVMIILLVRKHVLGFALAFFFINLALVSNIFFNIGAPMGERLVFHSSIGFCIVIAWLLYKGVMRLQPAENGQKVLAIVAGVLIICSGYVTMARNPDWKNNNTLFLTDVKKAPNSSLVNTNAGAGCMMLAKKAGDGAERREWFEKAIGYFSRTIEINPTHYFAYVNRGLCYFNMGYQAKALRDWDTVRKYEPNQVNVNRYLDIAGKYFFSMGNKYVSEHKVDSAIFAFTRGAEAAPNVGEIWYNLGNTYFGAGRYHEAKLALANAVKLMPAKPEIKTFYDQVAALDK